MEEINEKDFRVDSNAPKIDNNVYRTFEEVCLDDFEEWKKWQEHPLTKSLFKQLGDYSKYVDTHKAFPRILLQLNSATGKRVITNFFVRKPSPDDYVEYGLIKATDIDGNTIPKDSYFDGGIFNLTFDAPYFFEGDLITTSRILFRVIGGPVCKDNGYTCQVELARGTGNRAYGFMLQPGSNFSVVNGFYEIDL